jgi:predicted RNA-binding protein with PUA-like domain
LLTVVALGAEWAGVTRANYVARKNMRDLKNQNRFLKLAGEAMAETLDSIANGTPTEDAFQRFEEQKQYIEIVNNSL